MTLTSTSRSKVAASTEVSQEVSPSATASTGTSRTTLVAVTPAVLAICPATSGESIDQLSMATAKSALMSLAKARSAALLTEAPTTLSVVIRVTPMVSAEAVVAVRRGLRTAFSRASLPGVPNSLRSTGANSAITGRDSSGVRTKTPIISAPEPRPTRLTDSEAAPPTRPSAPPTANSRPMVLRTSSDFWVAGCSLELIAATGAIREARSEGSQADSTVTATPTRSEAITVPGAITSGPSGRLASRGPLSRACRPAAMPMPPIRPPIEAARPTSSASASTERVICLRLAPTPGAGRAPWCAGRSAW